MNPERYDVLFSGRLLTGATPDLVKRRLCEQLGFTEAEAEALFSGGTQVVKKGLDAEGAGRYQALFRSVGALVDLRAQSAGVESGGSAPETDTLSLAPADIRTPLDPSAGRLETASMPDTRGLGLAPSGGSLADAAPPPPAPRAVDISGLQLQGGQDWTFEDALIRIPEPPPPSTDHLSLESPHLEARKVDDENS